MNNEKRRNKTEILGLFSEHQLDIVLLDLQYDSHQDKEPLTSVKTNSTEMCIENEKIEVLPYYVSEHRQDVWLLEN